MSWRDGLMLIAALLVVLWIVAEIVHVLKRKRFR